MAKLATFLVSDEFLVNLTVGCVGGFSGRFKVKANGLPVDVRVESVGLRKGNIIAITVSSSEFKDVKKGKTPPLLPEPVLEALFGG